MLVRFSIGNFLSFKNVQEFSLLKGKVKNKSERVYDNKKIKLLKFAAIFGANASGKSNLVKAIKYARKIILEGIIDCRKYSAYKVDSSYKDKDTYFEFEILIGDKCYSYGFELNIEKGCFVSEWLLELSNNREFNIFTRDITKGEFLSDLNIKDSDLKTKFKVYSDDLKSNKQILLLNEMNSKAKRTLYEKNNELDVFKKVFEWFEDYLDVNYPDRPISDYSYFQNKSKTDICNIIKGLGTGITDYKYEHSSIEKLKTLPPSLLDKLEKDLQKSKDLDSEGKKVSNIIIRANDMYYMINLDKNNNLDVTTIVFNHGNDVTFGFDEESDGTRRILDLIEILFSEEDKVYVIDEIDRSLHPQLTYKFIEEFLKLAKEKNIQLIITTHESRLLDFGLLRQDEIWLTDKDANGETSIYSLDEYNVRFDQKVEKAYLEGRYGGVPIFTSIFPSKED